VNKYTLLAKLADLYLLSKEGDSYKTFLQKISREPLTPPQEKKNLLKERIEQKTSQKKKE